MILIITRNFYVIMHYEQSSTNRWNEVRVLIFERIVTARVAKRAKVMFLQAGVCSTWGGGGEMVLSWGMSLPGHHLLPWTSPPPGHHLLPGHHPHGKHIPTGHHPPGHHLPMDNTYGNYSQCAGGTHPTGKQSCCK